MATSGSGSGTTRKIGAHTLTVEDDVVFLALQGDYKLDDAMQTHAEIERLLSTLGRAFIAVDQTHGGATPPDARRFIADWNKRHRASGAVMFGGGLVSSAAATLVLSAIRLFQPDMLPMVFAKSELEARDWISAQRTKLLNNPSRT